MKEIDSFLRVFDFPKSSFSVLLDSVRVQVKPAPNLERVASGKSDWQGVRVIGIEKVKSTCMKELSKDPDTSDGSRYRMHSSHFFL